MTWLAPRRGRSLPATAEERKGLATNDYFQVRQGGFSKRAHDLQPSRARWGATAPARRDPGDNQQARYRPNSYRQTSEKGSSSVSESTTTESAIDGTIRLAPTRRLPPLAPIVRRALKHPRLMHYNRLIALVVLVNGACWRSTSGVGTGTSPTGPRCQVSRT